MAPAPTLPSTCPGGAPTGRWPRKSVDAKKLETLSLTVVGIIAVLTAVHRTSGIRIPETCPTRRRSVRSSVDSPEPDDPLTR